MDPKLWIEGNKGIPLKDLKKYLKDKKKMDVVMPDSSIKLALKKVVDKGILTIEDGSYKLKEARRRRSRSRSKGRKSSRRRRRRRSSGPKKGRSRRKRSGSKRRRKSKKRRSSPLRSRRRRKPPGAKVV